MDNKNMTALMKASINNHDEVVEVLLRFGANPRVQNPKGETALTFACTNENLIICKRLIVAKSNVNHKDGLGRSILINCVRHNKKTDVLSMLIESGADIHESDNDGNTVLHYAAQRAEGAKEIAQFLLKIGSNPYAFNK